MTFDIPDNQRLSDEDMLAQIPTFLLAAHETTSTSTTWALFALAQFLAAQARLRAELQACPTDAPTMEQLTALPYSSSPLPHAVTPACLALPIHTSALPARFAYSQCPPSAQNPRTAFEPGTRTVCKLRAPVLGHFEDVRGDPPLPP